MVGNYFKVDGKVCRVIEQHRHGVFIVKRLSDDALLTRVGFELKTLSLEERMQLIAHGGWSMLTNCVP